MADLIIKTLDSWSQITGGHRPKLCNHNFGLFNKNFCGKPAVAVIYYDADNDTDRYLRKWCAHKQVCIEHLEMALLGTPDNRDFSGAKNHSRGGGKNYNENSENRQTVRPGAPIPRTPSAI